MSHAAGPSSLASGGRDGAGVVKKAPPSPLRDFPKRLQLLVSEFFGDDDYVAFANMHPAVKNMVHPRMDLITIREAHAALERGEHIFLTGMAGTGKSYAIDQLKDMLPRNSVTPSGTTGTAAINIGGHTTASLFPYGFMTSLADIEAKRGKRKTRQTDMANLTSIKYLVVDEVSMLSAERMDAWMSACQSLRPNRPGNMGGLTLILCGDFMQLPPVEKDRQKEVRFAFESDAWRTLNIRTFELRYSHRHKEPLFRGIQKRARLGRLSENDLRVLETRIVQRPPEDMMHLYPTRRLVEAYNTLMLEKCQGEERTSACTDYVMSSHYSAAEERFIERAVPADEYSREINGILPHLAQKMPEFLTLRVGAMYTVTANVEVSAGLGNGTTVFLEGFRDNEAGVLSVYVRYKYMGVERTRELPRHTRVQEIAKISREKKVIFKREQIPLVLGFGKTIHSGQGLTTDEMYVDVQGTFERGQGYVAISRTRTLGGLHIKCPEGSFGRRMEPKLRASYFEAHPRAVMFYENVRSAKESFETNKLMSEILSQSDAAQARKAKIGRRVKVTGARPT